MGGFIVESQLEDWPVYKVRCLTSDAKQKPKYRILHRNCLLLVTNEDDTVVPGQQAQHQPHKAPGSGALGPKCRPYIRGGASDNKFIFVKLILDRFLYSAHSK